MFRTFVTFCLVLFLVDPAYAGQSEVREVARLNNCTPKKIEIAQNFLGGEGKTVYQVTCTLPKTTETESAEGPDAILIGCDQSLCTLIRPVSAEKK
jgi:hypothetical protein